MPRTFKALSFIPAIAMIMAAASTGAFAQTDTEPQSRPAERTADVRLKVKKGQYLSIIMPEARADHAAQRERQSYYRKALPLGQKFGLKREAQLKVDTAVISDFEPTGLIFFSYPDAASEMKLTGHQSWPTIKAQRPKAWHELRIYSAAVENDLNLLFDPAKFYTLVVAWTNPEKPDDYQNYLSGIETAVHAAGGEFIFKMHNPKMEAHATALKAPNQLTFVEWETADGFEQVQKTAAYKASAPYIRSGARKIEFYRMSVNGKAQPPKD
ncbi:MAG: hypothetical protein ABJO01_02445 [Parasphingorhabdus sp.]|uniref:hypothetical protein n=1 Tax=Parasphingorhabdus sp. TaxID=2709688 RepID=UPI003299CD66